MRANPAEYTCVKATSLADVLERLSSAPGYWKPLAGGTDLMVMFAAGKLAHKNFVDISHLSEIKKIDVTHNAIVLGGGVTYSQIAENAVIAQEFPNLKKAAMETGAIAIQNQGTLGGNIANASPIADSPPALLTYGAQIFLSSKKSSRTVDYADFHLSYKKTILEDNELITAILLPRKKFDLHFYWKVGTRKAQAISKVCVSATANFSGMDVSEIKIALGGVAPTTIRAKNAEKLLDGKSLKSAQKTDLEKAIEADVCAIDDIRSNKAYRTTVTKNLVCHLLEKMKNHVGLDS